MIENIRSVVSVNDTCVYFRTSGTTADEVHVCNGRAFAILPVYEPYQPGKPRVRKPNEMREVDICFADVECSALRIDDASNADALLAKADEALVAGGFPTRFVQVVLKLFPVLLLPIATETVVIYPG